MKVIQYIKIVTVILLSISAVPSYLSAQQIWTLRSCIDYAREKNIQVQKAQLSTESYDVDILQSKAELFPNLTGNISQRFLNSKERNSSGDYKNKGIFSGEYGLTASMTIYDGKRTLNNIKQAKLQKDVQELNTQEIQNNIEISITEAYLQMLYNREAIKNNENIVASSEAALKQAQIFLNAGSINKSELAQIEAQYSSDKYNLVLAQNSFDNYKLQLKQLLELDVDTDFNVEFPEINDDVVMRLIPSKQEVYKKALLIMPQIESSKLGIEVANISKSNAKAGYLPKLTLSGNLGSNNNYNQSPSFTSQLNRNFSQSISLNLSIPIFDNRQNKSNVQKAQIEIQNAQLTLMDTQKELLRTVESLYQDAVSAQSKYIAAKDKLKSTELSYELTQEQYSLGMRNTVELTTEKNNYANALQELLQAKYTALLSLKLLNFYQGEEINI